MTCLPIILFHKVRTFCVLFRAQIAMVLWTEIVCLYRKTLIGKPYRKRKLQYDECRHPYIKLLVHGLVMKSLHPKPCTYTATHKRHLQECRLRNAPFPFLSLILVNAVSKERYDIDKYKISHYKVQPIHLPNIFFISASLILVVGYFMASLWSIALPSSYISATASAKPQPFPSDHFTHC